MWEHNGALHCMITVQPEKRELSVRHDCESQRLFANIAVGEAARNFSKETQRSWEIADLIAVSNCPDTSESEANRYH